MIQEYEPLSLCDFLWLTDKYIFEDDSMTLTLDIYLHYQGEHKNSIRICFNNEHEKKIVPGCPFSFPMYAFNLLLPLETLLEESI